MNAPAASVCGLAVAVLLAGCAALPVRPAAEVRTVEAEGWAALAAGDMPGTRRRALADALRRAVEAEAGVYLEAQVRVDDAASVRQRIVSGARGRVVRYSVLSEREEEGFLKLRVKAVIALPSAEEEARRGDRVHVVVAAADPGSRDAADAAGAAVGESLRRRGFRIVEPGAGVVELRLAVRAEPVQDPRLGAMRSARVTLEATARDGRARAVLWNGVETRAALGADAAGAGAAAGGEAGRAVGEAAAQALKGLADGGLAESLLGKQAWEPRF